MTYFFSRTLARRDRFRSPSDPNTFRQLAIGAGGFILEKAGEQAFNYISQKATEIYTNSTSAQQGVFIKQEKVPNWKSDVKQPSPKTPTASGAITNSYNVTNTTTTQGYYPYGHRPGQVYKYAMVNYRGRRRMAYRPRRVIPRRNKGYTSTRGFYRAAANKVSVEKKFVDQALGVSAFDDGDAWQPALFAPNNNYINGVQQGTGASERLGEQTTLRSIQLDLEIQPDSVNAPVDPSNFVPPTGMRIEIVLLQDKQCNGTIAAAANIFTFTSEAGSLINMSNRQRFKIMKRWTIMVNSDMAGTNTADTLVFQYPKSVLKYYGKMKMPIFQSGTEFTNATMRSNGISLWYKVNGGKWTSNIGTPQEVDVQMNIKSRVRYTDQ